MKFPKISHLLTGDTHKDFNFGVALIKNGRIQALNRHCGVYLHVNDFIAEDERKHVENKILDKELLERIEAADIVEFKEDGILLKYGLYNSLEGLRTDKVPYSGVLSDSGEVYTYDEMFDAYDERSDIKVQTIDTLLRHVLLPDGRVDATKWKTRRTTYFKSLMFSYKALIDIVNTLVFDLDQFGNINVDMYGEPKTGTTKDAPTTPLIISAACTELTENSSIVFMMPSFEKPKK